MPVRSRTSGRSTELTATPASCSATCGARSNELTRASTAIDAVVTSGSSSQARTRATAAVPPSSRPWSMTRSAPVVGSFAGPGSIDLVDPAVVVAEQRAGSVDDLDGTAVVDGERVRRGAGEQPLVVDEERRVGAGVSVDALVVVADAEHVETGARQQADEQHVRRREVLELVDEEVPARALHRAAELAVGQQRLDGGVDLLVEVDGAALGEPAAIGREQLGETGDVVAASFDVVRIGEAETDRRQPFDVRPDRIGVGPALAPARQQRVDQAAHLGFVEHGRRGPTVFGEHPQAERVERADARREVDRARLHLQLGLLVVGDGEH